VKEIQITPYNPDKKQAWDALVKRAKNATFLFRRDFLEYHAHRFEDFSLMIYVENELVALLPANKTGNELHSHQGLSYGGLVLKKEISFETVVSILKSLLKYLHESEIKKLHIKLLPKIYHLLPSDEMDYLLFKLNSQRTRCDLASAIDYQNPLKITSSNRVRGLKKARKNNLQIRKETDFTPFWNKVLIPNLQVVHDTEPVHSLSEIQHLQRLFPDEIHQFSVYDGEEIIAGTTVFETENVVHLQYISAFHKGRSTGALDLLFHKLIAQFSNKRYFTFGISNEQQGQHVNKGLLHWKESFGARSIAYEFFTIETKNYPLLNTVFL